MGLEYFSQELFTVAFGGDIGASTGVILSSEFIDNSYSIEIIHPFALTGTSIESLLESIPPGEDFTVSFTPSSGTYFGDGDGLSRTYLKRGIVLTQGSTTPSSGDLITLTAYYPIGSTHQWQISQGTTTEDVDPTSGVIGGGQNHIGMRMSSTWIQWIGAPLGQGSTLDIFADGADHDTATPMWTFTSDVVPTFGQTSTTSYYYIVQASATTYNFSEIFAEATNVTGGFASLDASRLRITETVYNNFEDISGATGSTYQFSAPTEDGRYRVQANVSGASSVSNVISVASASGAIDVFALATNLLITVTAFVAGATEASVIVFTADSGLSTLPETASGMTFTFSDEGGTFNVSITEEMTLNGTVSDTSVGYNISRNVVTTANGFDANFVGPGTFLGEYTPTAATLTE